MQRRIVAQEVVGRKEEGHLDQKAKGGAHSKDRVVLMLPVEGCCQHVALASLEGLLYALELLFHVMLHAPFRLLPGLCQMVERQEHDIDNDAHEDQGHAVGAKGVKACLKHGAHNPLKRSYEKIIEIVQHIVLSIAPLVLFLPFPVTQGNEPVGNDRPGTAEVVYVFVAETAQTFLKARIL